MYNDNNELPGSYRSRAVIFKSDTILQNLYYISDQKKAGNSNQDLIHKETLIFRDVIKIRSNRIYHQ